MASSPADHALAEIDDDGDLDRKFRRYRYVCRCGKTGPWQDGGGTAKCDHAVHRSDVIGGVA